MSDNNRHDEVEGPETWRHQQGDGDVEHPGDPAHPDPPGAVLCRSKVWAWNFYKKDNNSKCKEADK
nr:hypothetical protein FFPRI1PSEUD_12910 [Pseudomonas sp. FFPRI_1]